MRALEFLRDHVTFKLPYEFSNQMKTPTKRLNEIQVLLRFSCVHMMQLTLLCQLSVIMMSWQLSNNPWLFSCFDFGSFRNVTKIRSLSIGFHSRDCSKVWSKMKTRKNQGLVLNCAQVNSSLWQRIATYVSRQTLYFPLNEVE